MDFVGNTLLADDFSANAARLGLDAAAMEAPRTIATWVVVDFLMGILVVFTYAAIRPRFGGGPKTAVLGGAVIWLAVSLVLYGFSVMGMMDMPLYWKATAISLVNVLVGSVVGGWIYKEE
jgi:hypothetical protein